MRKLFLAKLHNLILSKGSKEDAVNIILDFLKHLGYSEIVDKFNCIKE